MRIARSGPQPERRETDRAGATQVRDPKSRNRRLWLAGVAVLCPALLALAGPAAPGAAPPAGSAGGTEQPGTPPAAPDPALWGAEPLHELGVDGSAVTIALVGAAGTRHAEPVGGRVRARIRAAEPPGVRAKGDGEAAPRRTPDRLGHIAPGADWVLIEALDDRGRGTYLDVLRAVDWVVSHQGVHEIQVLVLPLTAPGGPNYWEDPLGRAVMEAWRAGIVVVAAAGAEGGSLPGSVPYVVTVAGERAEAPAPAPGPAPRMAAFAKPDVLVPGARHARLDPEALPAATVVGEVVALLLEREPWLTPDDVKCRLLASARPPAAPEAGGPGGLERPPGTLDAWAAATSEATGCANRGLDLDLDLGGARLAAGPSGAGSTAATAGWMWSGVWKWSDGYRWSDARRAASRPAWSDGYM